MSTVAAEPHPFALEARFGELAGLAAKNALLGLITLTLYRFWARTTMRRRLWSRTSLLGDPLEYTGSGWELFRGFLISLPTFFLPAIFVLYLAPLAFEPGAAFLLLIGFYAIAVPLMNAARYWMRRYQLSRTRWRGIRLALAGSAWAYAWASIGWSLLELATLGWYGPVARMRRAKLLWENARYGDQPFAFCADEANIAAKLYGPFALGWFGTPIAFALGMFVGALAIGGYIALTGAAPDAPPVGAIVLGVLSIVLGFAFVLLVWTPFNAAAMNRIAAHIELDGARFRLKLTTFGLFAVTLQAIAIFVLTLGFLAPLAGAIYVRHIFNRLEMIGAPRFAAIGQSIVAPPDSAEGIADAFDLDLGVGVV